MQEVTLENVRAFVEEDPYNVDSFNSVGMPILSWCVFHGQRDVVEYLISMDADVNIRDLSNNTPLHIAVLRGDVSLARYLVECQANISATNSEGKTPLHMAVLQQRTEVNNDELLTLLIESTYDFSIPDHNGKNVLYYCGVNLDLFAQIVDRIYHLDQPQVLWELKVPHRTPLHLQVLWESRDSNGKTLLMNYITNVAMVKYILSHPGINVNVGDKRGQTALHHAVICGDVAIVKLLLLYPKCQREKRDHLQQTPLDFAEKLGHSEIADLLLV